MTQAKCSHFDGTVAQPHGAECEGCGSKVNLRVCTTCGHVGCCASQQGHNATHAKSSGHPIIKSLPLGPSSFTWCYTCNAYV